MSRKSRQWGDRRQGADVLSGESGHQFIRRFTRWGLMVCTASVVSVVSAVPTQAGELTEWGYDPQTRSLNVVLPNTIAPAISVLTPTQLLLALPDTQTGEVMEQIVGDGVVESIVLKQATPDTVWMVVEFVAGSVLADVQNATQTALADEDLRQWQIRPALESLPRAINPVANQLSPLPPTDDAASAGAASLRAPVRKISQSPDFPDLPVLEPALLMGESVSVPRIEPSLEQAIPVRSSPVQVSVPQPSEQIEVNQSLDEVAPTVGVSPIAIPVISHSESSVSDPPVADREEPDEVAADEITTDEVAVDEITTDEVAVDEITTDEVAVDEITTDEIAVDETTTDEVAADAITTDEVAINELAIDEVGGEGIPSEPPFLGDVGTMPIESATISNSDRLPALEPLVAESVPVVQVPTVAIPAVAIPTVEVPAIAIPAVDVPTVDAPAVASPIPSVRPNRVNRWPDPVPFGQPLPETR